MTNQPIDNPKSIVSDKLELKAVAKGSSQEAALAEAFSRTLTEETDKLILGRGQSGYPGSLAISRILGTEKVDPKTGLLIFKSAKVATGDILYQNGFVNAPEEARISFLRRDGKLQLISGSETHLASGTYIIIPMGSEHFVYRADSFAHESYNHSSPCIDPARDEVRDLIKNAPLHPKETAKDGWLVIGRKGQNITQGLPSSGYPYECVSTKGQFLIARSAARGLYLIEPVINRTNPTEFLGTDGTWHKITKRTILPEGTRYRVGDFIDFLPPMGNALSDEKAKEILDTKLNREQSSLDDLGVPEKVKAKIKLSTGDSGEVLALQGKSNTFGITKNSFKRKDYIMEDFGILLEQSDGTTHLVAIDGISQTYRGQERGSGRCAGKFISQKTAELLEKGLSGDEIIALLPDALLNHQRQNQQKLPDSMGACIVVASFKEDRGEVSWAGDCAVIEVSAEEARWINWPHDSVATYLRNEEDREERYDCPPEELEGKAMIETIYSKHSSFSNEINRHVSIVFGEANEAEPETIKIKLKSQAIYIVASDGLTKAIEARDLPSLYKEAGGDTKRFLTLIQEKIAERITNEERKDDNLVMLAYKAS